MTIKLPPSAKLRREARPDGGYSMVPAYTTDEVISIIKSHEVNINDYVRIKLNDVGRAHLSAMHDELMTRVPKPWPYVERQVDEAGYSEFQLHDVMRTFGGLCTLGSEPPFCTVILIGGAK